MRLSEKDSGNWGTWNSIQPDINLSAKSVKLFLSEPERCILISYSGTSNFFIAKDKDIATMKFSGNPLVIIGLDGCEWKLINPWIETGELPVLARIKKEGVYARMVSTIPPITAPALTSFMTGLNPDNTGITGFLNFGEGLISYNDIQAPCIWDFLGEAGIRSCVVGLRLTYPPKTINGIMLSGGLLRTSGNDYIKPESIWI